jgi:hypothetical protein
MTTFKVSVQTAQRLDDGKHFWFEVPNGMSTKEAFETQLHHGPFETEMECDENAMKALPMLAMWHVTTRGRQ